MMLDQREKDIQELCRQVLEEIYVEQDYNNGTCHCPFCGNASYYDEMSKIDHEQNCAYLIAKDLSTGTGMNKK